MSKVTLVIDEPMCCDDCPLMFENDCGVTQTHMQLEYGELYYPRPSWCPLKLLPQKKSIDYDIDHIEDEFFAYGWNDCIDTILENNNETNI